MTDRTRSDFAVRRTPYRMQKTPNEIAVRSRFGLALSPAPAAAEPIATNSDPMTTSASALGRALTSCVA
jgi:hypothetical protein